MPIIRSKTPFLVVAFIALLVSIYLLMQSSHSVPRLTSTGPEWNPHAYIWQRAWTDSVRTAVHDEGPAFARLVVLARQIDWREGAPRSIRVAVDWQSLRSSGASIGAAIRINPNRNPFDTSAADRLCDTLRDLATEAKTAGIPLAEIQIDFDAATSQLPAYRAWLQRARTVTPIPITITALPSWMNSPAFSALAHDAGYYVLQVHWLVPPKKATDNLVLCDIPTARRAMERAARIGVPFRLALPTYGYLAAFHPDGSFAAIAAEDAPHDWAAGMTLRTVEANSAELAAFVDQLAHDRPAAMLGIIWYRLPIDTDRMNWSWPTLKAVMRGRPPKPAALTITCAETDGVQDISLKNTGEQDAPLQNTTLRISWENTEKIAADGLNNFQPDPISDHALDFHPPPETFAQLKPGASIHVGWIRFSSKAQPHAELVPTTSTSSN